MRAQCALLGEEDCMMLLEGMLHWNPSSRITMYDVLHANLFTIFLSSSSPHQQYDTNNSTNSIMEYMHYYCANNSHKRVLLPNV